MALHNANPVRTQIRQEIIEALADGQPRTAEQLYGLCPSANDASEISKIAYELRRSGLIDHGDKAKNAMNMGVNTYLRATTNAYLDAAKPIQVERKIKRTAKAPKPAASNPYTHFSISKPQEAAPRVTRDLPQHLQSTAPIAAQEAVMSQEPTPYIVNPPFALEPKAPDAEEDIDSELIDALQGLAEFVPLPRADDDDVLAMASADVGEIAQALKEKKTPEPLLSHHANKSCQCLRINSLPRLPRAYRYASIITEIISDNDCETLTLRILDEGAGPFLELDTTGRVRFDRGELAMISQAADSFIVMMEEDDHGR
jgi:hypothetical protein